MVIERHEVESRIAEVDSDLTMEDNMHVPNDGIESVVANAMLEVEAHGLTIPNTEDSTLQDIAAMIVDAWEDVYAFDLASYWRGNFVIFGLI